MCRIKDNTTIVRVATIVSLVQSLIWIPVSIVAIQLYRCKITITGDGGGPYLIYLVYFFNVKCANAPDFLKILEPGWPLEPVYPSERTRIIFILILIFNLLWVLTSAALLVSTFQICFIKMIPKFFYYFGWILTTIGILILDLVGFSLLGYDFYKTSSPDGLLRVLGVTELIDKWETYMPSRYYDSPAVPTAVILPLISRLFPILWIIDLILLIRVVKTARQHEVTYREAFAKVQMTSNPLYRQSRWKDDGTNLQLRSSQVAQEEEQQMQPLNHEQENHTTQENKQDHDYAILEQEEDNEEHKQNEMQEQKESKNRMSEYEDVNVANSNTDLDDDDDTRIYEPPMRTSSPQPARASLLKRISSQSQAPQGLQNQLPWSYLRRESNDDEHPLSNRTSSLKADGGGLREQTIKE